MGQECFGWFLRGREVCCMDIKCMCMGMYRSLSFCLRLEEAVHLSGAQVAQRYNDEMRKEWSCCQTWIASRL